MNFTNIFSAVKQAISNLTIRRKLITIIMLACTLSLFLVGSTFIFWQWFSLRRSMVRTLSTQAKVIADNCKASITFDEPQDANDVLKALMTEPSILFGGVYTVDGDIFASYYRGNQDRRVSFLKIQSSGHFFKDKLLTVFEPITVEGKNVGIVCLRATLSNLRQTLKRDIAVVVGVLFIVSLLIFFVSAGLQKIISEPILELADVAKVISDKKEYSIRVNRSSKDELGLLITAFNEMLAQIQQRDLALVNSNEQLEKKVEERTADLKEEVAVRRKAENELAKTVKKLTISNRELREFTRIAAHDLQTPLRSIGILSDWMSEDYARKFDKKGQKNAALLISRAKRMSRLLNAVIEYSEISLVDRKQECLDLNYILSNIIANMEVSEDIEIRIENKLPVVMGVHKFIYELFSNLISNAVRYMDKPKGVIKIRCVDDGGFWKFSVADNGCGIEEKYFKKIFEIFQMLSLRDETENVGIGLSIVKKIVELYDGRVWVESESGQGSTFFFTFPKLTVVLEKDLRILAGSAC
ncbi:MAG: HAMP domain-containing protein [Sedimentisphaerales bacterium]|nr:HAMP domain-containing protein [Sedimentisphaerales bacterium]